MLDLIGYDEPATTESPQQPQCMVFEWMDTDLWQLPSGPFRSGSQLPRIVARSILEALAVTDGEQGVHTDVNPNNLFLSGLDSPFPTVKLGDLGNCWFSNSSHVTEAKIFHSDGCWPDVQRSIPGKQKIMQLDYLPHISGDCAALSNLTGGCHSRTRGLDRCSTNNPEADVWSLGVTVNADYSVS